MTPRTAVVGCLLGLALLLGPVAMAAPAPADVSVSTGNADADGAAQDDAAESATPGERLAGAIGAEQAEVDGEVNERRFGVRIARAETEEDTADVVATQFDDVEQRLDELEARLDELQTRAEDGDLPPGQYAARVARIEAERRSLERQLEHGAAAAEDLPADVRADRGVDDQRVQQLRDRASELSGPEVREIARGIAGPNVGNGVGPPEHVPGHVPGVGNVSERGPPEHAAARGIVDGDDRDDADDTDDPDDGDDSSDADDAADADDPNDSPDPDDADDEDDADDPADADDPDDSSSTS